jgi:hypothetical protein
MIAVTPVAPPPLDLQERAVQLTSAVGGDLAGLVGDVGQVVNGISGAGGSSGLIGGLLNPGTALTDIGNLPNVGDLSNLGALLDPVSGLASAASGIQTAPSNAIIMFLETATNNGALLISLATALFDLSGVLVQHGFLGLATLATALELALELAGFALGASASTMPADAAIGVSSLGAPLDPAIGLSGLDPTASVVPDLMLSPTTAVSDLGTLLNPGDLTALLNPGDLSTLLNPADFATLFDPVGIGSVLGTLAADIPTMLLSLIP